MTQPVKPPTDRAASRFVAFKLDPQTAAAFETLAAKRRKTPGLLAKDLALRAIAEASAPDPQEAAAGIDELQQTIARLSRALADSVHALLVRAGTASPEEAARWVLDNWTDERGNW